MPGTEGNGDKFRAGKFQGRVEEALLNIANDITDVKKEMKCIKEKVNNNRFKIAGIGATISFVVTILVLLMRELMGK